MSYAFTSLTTLGAGLGSARGASVAVDFVDPSRWRWTSAGYVYGDSLVPFGEDFSALAHDVVGTPTEALQRALNESVESLTRSFPEQVARLRSRLGVLGSSPFASMGQTVTASLSSLQGQGMDPRSVVSFLADIDGAFVGGRGSAALDRVRATPVGEAVQSALGAGTVAADIGLALVSISERLASGQITAADALGMMTGVISTVSTATSVLAGTSAAMLAGPQAVVGVVLSVFTALVGFLTSLTGPPPYEAAAAAAAQHMTSLLDEDEQLRELQRLEMGAWRSWIQAFDTIVRLVREDMAASGPVPRAAARVASITVRGDRRGTVLRSGFRTTMRVRSTGGWLMACKDERCVLPIEQDQPPAGDWKVWRWQGQCGSSSLYDWCLAPPARITAKTADYTTGRPSTETPDHYDIDNRSGHWSAARQLALLRSSPREPIGRRLRQVSELYADERGLRAFYFQGDERFGIRTSRWTEPQCAPWPGSRSTAPQEPWGGIYACRTAGRIEPDSLHRLKPASWAGRPDGDVSALLRCAALKEGVRPTQANPRLVRWDCTRERFVSIWGQLGVDAARAGALWNGDAAVCWESIAAKPEVLSRADHARRSDYDAWEDIWDLDVIRTWFRSPNGFLATEAARDPVVAHALSLLGSHVPPDASRAWDDRGVGWSRFFTQPGWRDRSPAERAKAFNDAADDIALWRARFNKASLELILTLTTTVQNKLHAQIAAKTLKQRLAREERLGRQVPGYWGTAAMYADTPPLGGSTNLRRMGEELSRMAADRYLSADSIWAFAALTRGLLDKDKRERAREALRAVAFSGGAAPVYSYASLLLLRVDGSEQGGLTELPRKHPDSGGWRTNHLKRITGTTHEGARDGAWARLRQELDESLKRDVRPEIADLERMLFAKDTSRRDRLQALLLLHEHGHPKVLQGAEEVLPDVLADQTTERYSEYLANAAKGAVQGTEAELAGTADAPREGDGAVLPWVVGAAALGGLAWWLSTRKP